MSEIADLWSNAHDENRKRMIIIDEAKPLAFDHCSQPLALKSVFQ